MSQTSDADAASIDPADVRKEFDLSFGGTMPETTLQERQALGQRTTRTCPADDCRHRLHRNDLVVSNGPGENHDHVVEFYCAIHGLTNPER